uniref:Uncharacterized protein n=1 Tax=Strigamia maritima TaxID=126957 RepID=T1II72_STRMM
MARLNICQPVLTDLELLCYAQHHLTVSCHDQSELLQTYKTGDVIQSLLDHAAQLPKLPSKPAVKAVRSTKQRLNLVFW